MRAIRLLGNPYLLLDNLFLSREHSLRDKLIMQKLISLLKNGKWLLHGKNSANFAVRFNNDRLN